MFPNGILNSFDGRYTLVDLDDLPLHIGGRWTALKTHPLQADLSLQNSGRESAEDFYY